MHRLVGGLVLALAMLGTTASAQSVSDSAIRGFETGQRAASARNEERRRQAEFEAEQQARRDARAAENELVRACGEAREAGLAWAAQRDASDLATLKMVGEPAPADVDAYELARLARQRQIAEGYARCISSRY